MEDEPGNPEDEPGLLHALRESAAAPLTLLRHPDYPADKPGHHAAFRASVDDVTIDLDAEDDGYDSLFGNDMDDEDEE